MRNKRVSVSVRLLPDIRYRLQVLAQLLQTSQAAVLESLISALYLESLHDWSGTDLADALTTAKRRASGLDGSSRTAIILRNQPRRKSSPISRQALLDKLRSL